MADERSTERTHAQNPDQKEYDWAYYNWIMPHVYGSVLDIGSGNLMFVREYAKKDFVGPTIVCLDKFTDSPSAEETIKDAPTVKNLIKLEWTCPDEFPKMAYENDFYHTIVSTEFVEHITEEHLDLILERIKPLLWEYGFFLGSTPNKLVPTTNPYHLREYTAAELKEKLEQHFQDVVVEVLRGDLTVWKASRPR